MSISPWMDSVKLTSPNGRITATIRDAIEVAMGAPTRGQLILSNGISVPNCNPSIVWSSDSEYLAVPQWTSDRRQRLLVIAICKKQLGYAPDVYDVLHLDAFHSGIITGIHSPIHLPRAIKVALSDIEWRK
ncbi:MAG: hypothetical protein AMXMBFR82_53970 [Candidatus Hydrogenedentota bacterium]